MLRNIKCKKDISEKMVEHTNMNFPGFKKGIAPEIFTTGITGDKTLHMCSIH